MKNKRIRRIPDSADHDRFVRSAIDRMSDLVKDRQSRTLPTANAMRLSEALARWERSAKTDEDFMQLVRAGESSFPPDAHFYRVAESLLLVTKKRIGERLTPRQMELSERMDAIEREHGLPEDEDWTEDEDLIPPEWTAAMDEYVQIDESLPRISAFDVMREFGEADMADLFERDPLTFHRRYEAGRCFFYGPPDEERQETLRFEEAFYGPSGLPGTGTLLGKGRKDGKNEGWNAFPMHEDQGRRDALPGQRQDRVGVLLLP